MSKVGRFWVFGSDCGYFGACVGHEFSGVAGGGRYRLLIFTYVWMGSYMYRYQMEARWLYTLKMWVFGGVIG